MARSRSWWLARWALLYISKKASASVASKWIRVFMLQNSCRVAFGPAARDRFPVNRRLPLAYRLLQVDAQNAPVRGELARDSRLATIEAALFAADEPLNARRLGEAAGIRDGNEARRLV